MVDPNRKTLADRIRARPEAAVEVATNKRGKKAKAQTAAASTRVAPNKTRGKARAKRERRPKKTVEQLDAEMADYFVQAGGATAAAAPAAAAPAVDMGDIPM